MKIELGIIDNYSEVTLYAKINNGWFKPSYYVDLVSYHTGTSVINDLVRGNKQKEFSYTDFLAILKSQYLVEKLPDEVVKYIKGEVIKLKKISESVELECDIRDKIKYKSFKIKGDV